MKPEVRDVIATFIVTPGHVNTDTTSFFWNEALSIVSSNFGSFVVQTQSTLTNRSAVPTYNSPSTPCR